jgi:molybdate transport system substrate-binding protein
MPAFVRRCLACLALLLTPFATLAAEVTVSAAASLTNAFRDLAPLFEAAHPGHRVQFNFAASGALLQQIAKGAPVDVFASADQDTMDQAQARKLIVAALRRNIASNALVVIVPAHSTLAPGGLADLAQPAYRRIAIGLPASVPVGRYTRGVLEAARLWPSIEPRMIAAHNVRQALDYVARAEVDAGFVYATDAALMPDKVKRVLTVPTAVPILYPAAPVAGSAQPDLARRFLDFLGTPPAQAVMARHGFGRP